MASKYQDVLNFDVDDIKNEDVCRTCLSKQMKMYSVFDNYIGSVALFNAINTVTGIKISIEDGLPHIICNDCKEKAILTFEFMKKTQETENMLQELLNSKQTEPQIKTEQSIPDNFYDDVNPDFPDASDLNNLDTIKSEINFNIESFSQCKKKKMEPKYIKVEIEDNYCPICESTYQESISLSDHMCNIHGQLIPKKRGRPRKALENTLIEKLTAKGIHIKTIKIQNCVICQEQYKSQEELRNHFESHKETIIHSCLQCKRMFLNKSSFEQHRCITSCRDIDTDIVETINTPNENTYFLSEVCFYEILESNGDMDKLAVCEICNELILDYNLLSHNDAQHPELSQRCNLCSKVFASLKSAARHRETCKNVERKFICSTCGQRFPYEISLNKHILKSHEGQSVSVKFIDPKSKLEDKQYQCDTCNKCFYRKDLLDKHVKMHLPNEKSYECDVCNKTFYRRDGLRSHKRVHEVRDKPSSSTCLCLYCGRNFSNSSNLIVHMRRHTGEKPYKCDFCGKGFPRSSDLQCHRRMHTGEKPCICRVCGKGFSRSNKLSRHMRVHTGDKPYKCTYCEKAFSQSNDLTLHIRRHTGDKPYICDVCGDRFIQGTALQSHRRVHGHYRLTDPQNVSSKAVSYNNAKLPDSQN